MSDTDSVMRRKKASDRSDIRRNWKLLVITVFFTVIASILIFDVLAYFFAPKELVAFAPAYRRSNSRALEHQTPGGAFGYPRDYFQADDQVGFDIRPNVSLMKYRIADASYDIFSNELGCFDKNSLAQIKTSPNYTYFAGDSFTWGYADYASKYPTVYESETGHLSVKCGVSHTGQRHQYEKFLRIVNTIGRYPKRVFVGYFSNDPANDFAYPHSAVIDGFLVDTVELKDHELVKRDVAEIRNAIHAWTANTKDVSAEKSGETLFASIRRSVVRYSLTAHLISNAVVQLKYIARLIVPSAAKSFYEASRQFSFKDTYLSSDVTIANREVILKWASHAKTNHYELVFLLIPPKEDFDNPEYYQSLKRFLDENGVTFYDLTAAFLNAKKKPGELYWGKDPHWNNEGNAFVGSVLTRRFP